MENIIRLSISLMLVIQIISTLIYFKPFFEDWITDNRKHRWVNKRDRVILFFSICYLILSYLLLKNTSIENPIFNYSLSILILTITIILLLFQWKRFKIFKKNINKKHKKKKETLIENKFTLKKISEDNLHALINESFTDHFTNDFNDFKSIFIEQNFQGNKLNSTFKVHRNKRFGYEKIFELMHSLSENGVLDLFDNNKSNNKPLLEFIAKNFQKGGENIKSNNVGKAFSVWADNNR